MKKSIYNKLQESEITEVDKVAALIDFLDIDIEENLEYYLEEGGIEEIDDKTFLITEKSLFGNNTDEYQIFDEREADYEVEVEQDNIIARIKSEIDSSYHKAVDFAELAEAECSDVEDIYDEVYMHTLRIDSYTTPPTEEDPSGIRIPVETLDRYYICKL